MVLEILQPSDHNMLPKYHQVIKHSRCEQKKYPKRMFEINKEMSQHKNI